MRTEPFAPPFAVGDRVRFTGTGGFRYGDNPLVENGDIGVVVENHEGQAGRPDLGDDLADPLDGWSTLDIKGNRLALHADDLAGRTMRFELVGPEQVVVDDVVVATVERHELAR